MVRPGERALGELPPEDVQRHAEERPAESTPEQRGGADAERVREGDRERHGTGRGLGSGEGESPVPSERGGHAEPRSGPKSAARSKLSGFDYAITAKDEIGAGGPRVKYARNVEAIKTVRAIEAEGRSATPEEQAQLGKYTGGDWTGALVPAHRATPSATLTVKIHEGGWAYLPRANSLTERANGQVRRHTDC
ncbi:MAG TPA: hypothetical protein VMU57_02885 [Edaphobacter sp.]|uniref:hypothetical protein n=1 Tax=Edaphobacter sp. TaxID=1934404 RepID=UPI002C244AC7|nr:hypothetical protein [Edaphobacter sp.]HUZ93836.1 hypothetical protein [Edaphobacter sp.]